MRTFIAVEIPAELRNRLSAVAGELAGEVAAGQAEQATRPADTDSAEKRRANDLSQSPIPSPQSLFSHQNATSVLRWSDPRNFHLTLRFLGETTPVQRQQIGAMLERATAGCPPLSLALDGVGVFPNWRKMRVLWVGVTGGVERLERLQKEVEAGVQACGFAVERQVFHPHSTLARVSRNANRGLIAQAGTLLAAQTKLAQSLGQWEVSEVVLMRSDLRPTGSAYTVLERFGLTG